MRSHKFANKLYVKRNKHVLALQDTAGEIG